MFVKYLIYLIFFQVIGGCRLSDEKFQDLIGHLIPDQLDEIPANQLCVVYNGEEINPGDELTPYNVLNAPQLFWPSKPNYYYNLIMYDADAPSRTNRSLSDFVHWLVGNIPGNKLAEGDHIAGYLGGDPPKNTGLHRYIFLMYEVPHKIEFYELRSMVNSRRNRARFNLGAFCRKYSFNEVFAANYFQAEWEPFVEEWSRFITD